MTGSLKRGLRGSANNSVIYDSLPLNNLVAAEYSAGERSCVDNLFENDFEFTGPPTGIIHSISVAFLLFYEALSQKIARMMKDMLAEDMFRLNSLQ